MGHHRVAVLVPVLARPHRVEPLLRSLRETTSQAEVYFIPDPDDMDEKHAIAQAGGTVLCELKGNYARKINAAVEQVHEPLVFLAADDLEFERGWLEAAEAKLGQVVGVNDLCNPRTMAGEHATHFLMTREYARRPTIDNRPGPLCQAYVHNCVDDELIATAKRRGVYAFAHEAHVRHLHPMNESAPMDDTYRRGMATLRQDKRLFLRRQRRLFR